MTTLILTLAGIIAGMNAMGDDPRAHGDGGIITITPDFAGVVYIHERPNKSDLECWSGVFYDYERGNDAGTVILGQPVNIATECHRR